MAAEKKLMFLQSYLLPLVEWIIIGFSVLDAAVVLVISGTFLGAAIFVALRVVDGDAVLKTEEATKIEKK